MSWLTHAHGEAGSQRSRACPRAQLGPWHSSHCGLPGSLARPRPHSSMESKPLVLTWSVLRNLPPSRVVNCVCYDSGRCLIPLDSKFLEGNHRIRAALGPSLTQWAGGCGGVQKKWFLKRLIKNWLCLKKKVEEKDRSDTRWHHLPKSSFFFSIKSMSMYYFYKKKATILVLSNNYKKGKGFESKQSWIWHLEKFLNLSKLLFFIFKWAYYHIFCQCF